MPRAAGVAGGAEKALEPAAYRRCGGGGGQERLYGKPTMEKVLWQGELSSIWRGTQALTQGRNHAKNLNHRHGGGLDEETTIPGMEGGNTYSPARGGSVQPKKQRTNTTQKGNR